jgi:hypothetical protein
MLSKITLYYFGRRVIFREISSDEITALPPSHIMEILSSSLLQDKNSDTIFLKKIGEYIPNIMGYDDKMVEPTFAKNKLFNIFDGSEKSDKSKNFTNGTFQKIVK